MTKKQTELSEELREAVFEAARAGAAEAYTQNTGYVNYFKAMETLLYNYKKLAALVADEEAYCEVEYHAGRKFVMNKKTLFTDFMPLQDNSKNHIVTVQNNAYFVYGYPVLLSDYVADHEAFLGDFKKVCANLAENIGVKSAYDIDTNSYKYSGIAIFDCAPAIGEAIVKLVKATT